MKKILLYSYFVVATVVLLLFFINSNVNAKNIKLYVLEEKIMDSEEESYNMT